MNSVVISGRFTKTPTLKYTNNKMPWVSFPLAVNSGKDKEAYFPNCKAFDKTAETIDQWAEKGKLVIIQGHIATGSYTNKEGKKVYTTDVIVDRIEFCEKRSDIVPDEVDKEAQMSIPEGFSELLDDDIPF